MSEVDVTKDGPFEVTRVIPHELRSDDKVKRPIHSYNITNDEQRWQFVRKIVSKELTVKEVSPGPDLC
jgi:hypothetical protein